MPENIVIIARRKGFKSIEYVSAMRADQVAFGYEMEGKSPPAPKAPQHHQPRRRC